MAGRGGGFNFAALRIGKFHQLPPLRQQILCIAARRLANGLSVSWPAFSRACFGHRRLAQDVDAPDTRRTWSNERRTIDHVQFLMQRQFEHLR
jgi:hypothetical protein